METTIVTPIGRLEPEAEYEVALAEIEQLWAAIGGTPDGNKLYTLASSIDVYEAEQLPIDPPGPGQALLFRGGQMFGFTGTDALRTVEFIGSTARPRVPLE